MYFSIFDLHTIINLESRSMKVFLTSLIKSIAVILIIHSCVPDPKNEKIRNAENYKVILHSEVKLLTDYDRNIQNVALKENFDNKTYSYHTGNWNIRKNANIFDSYYVVMIVDNEFLSDLLAERKGDVDLQYKEALLQTAMFMKGRAGFSFTKNSFEYSDKPPITKLARNGDKDSMLIGPLPFKPIRVKISTGNHWESSLLR